LVEIFMGDTPALLAIPDLIETERLVIRSPMPGDGLAVNEALLETWDSLHHWMPWARERPTVAETEERARQSRINFVSRADLPMFMFLRERPTVAVGGTGLHRIDWAVPRFEIGYWVRRSLEGKGYVSEAVRALTRLAFGTLGAQRVEIHCGHRNLRSQRVAERCGFVLEGRLRNQRRETTGELRDTLVYALLPSDPATATILARPSR
jgi:RimJ/RimL family protein N-acetyltransferase